MRKLVRKKLYMWQAASLEMQDGCTDEHGSVNARCCAEGFFNLGKRKLVCLVVSKTAATDGT